jgi:hypothetical protein
LALLHSAITVVPNGIPIGAMVAALAATIETTICSAVSAEPGGSDGSEEVNFSTLVASFQRSGSLIPIALSEIANPAFRKSEKSVFSR